MLKIVRRLIFMASALILIILFDTYCAFGQDQQKLKIRFVSYFFENGSPVDWIVQGDTAVKISLIADHERDSPNSQTDHWNIRLDADSGTHVKLIISKLQAGAYNGSPVTDWWNFGHNITCYLSYDGRNWEATGTSSLPGHELLADFTMRKDYIYVARLPVYSIRNLEELKKRYEGKSLFKVISIGTTLENRPLEIIRLGDPDARNSVIIRARAHPWEPGGNWIVEGLVGKFMSENSEKWKKTFCVYIMPMANKDGVARGMTRFNIAGMDLNRKWDKMSDPSLCPEKYALEKFIEDLLKAGIKPSLGIDIHNDDGGGINFSTHNENDTLYLKNAGIFEKLMREFTCFSEKVNYSWKTPGAKEPVVLFEDGLFSRYGIEALVWELNANWNGKAGKMPSQDDWIESGKGLNNVFYRFFSERSPTAF